MVKPIVPITPPPDRVGIKHDSGKRRFSLLPPGTVTQVVDVLEFGAEKYGADNWRKVPEARQRYYDATMRHVDTWWQQTEVADLETGQHHLAHAVCCLLFLLALETEATNAPR